MAARVTRPKTAALLGEEATAAQTKDCLPSKAFLEILARPQHLARQGREMTQHVGKCWHCIDHFCRMAEVVELLRGVQPLSEAEAAPLKKKLGIETRKPPFWKR